MPSEKKRKRPRPENLRAFYKTLKLSDEVIDRAVEADVPKEEPSPPEKKSYD